MAKNRAKRMVEDEKEMAITFDLSGPKPTKKEVDEMSKEIKRKEKGAKQ